MTGREHGFMEVIKPEWNVETNLQKLLASTHRMASQRTTQREDVRQAVRRLPQLQMAANHVHTEGIQEVQSRADICTQILVHVLVDDWIFAMTSKVKKA